jgi:tyrosyl-tRNA synthetase
MRNHQSIPVVAQLLSDIVTGRAVAAEVIGRSLTAQAGFEPRSVHLGYVVGTLKLGRIFV